MEGATEVTTTGCHDGPQIGPRSVICVTESEEASSTYTARANPGPLLLEKARNRPFTGVYTANAQADVKIYQDIYQKMGNPQFDKAVDLLVAIGKHGFTIPASPAGAEFQQAWMDAVNRVLAGSQSPKRALDQAQREAQAAIRKAQK